MIERMEETSGNGRYRVGQDPEVRCSACGKTFLCDPMDAACRLCGAHGTIKSTARPAMTERVEEIRRRHADDLAMLAKNPRLVEKEWSDHPESWQDTADVRDLLTALAQAEREQVIQRVCTKCGYITVTQYGEELRAEVERLRDVYQEQINRREADLARVRAALEEALKYQWDYRGGGWEYIEEERADHSANAWKARQQARAALEGQG